MDADGAPLAMDEDEVERGEGRSTPSLPEFDPLELTTSNLKRLRKRPVFLLVLWRGRGPAQDVAVIMSTPATYSTGSGTTLIGRDISMHPGVCIKNTWYKELQGIGVMISCALKLYEQTVPHQTVCVAPG